MWYCWSSSTSFVPCNYLSFPCSLPPPPLAPPSFHHTHLLSPPHHHLVSLIILGHQNLTQYSKYSTLIHLSFIFPSIIHIPHSFAQPFIPQYSPHSTLSLNLPSLLVTPRHQFHVVPLSHTTMIHTSNISVIPSLCIFHQSCTLLSFLFLLWTITALLPLTTISISCFTHNWCFFTPHVLFYSILQAPGALSSPSLSHNLLESLFSFLSNASFSFLHSLYLLLLLTVITHLHLVSSFNFFFYCLI